MCMYHYHCNAVCTCISVKLLIQFFVNCRHQGQLHTEVIPTRLHGGRWRTYVIELSGNQLSLYVNCRLETQRLVPLPDYCINDDEVMLSVADSSYSQHEEYSGRERLHVSQIGYRVVSCVILYSQCEVSVHLNQRWL